MGFIKSLCAIIITALLLAGCANTGKELSISSPPDDLPLSEKMLLIRDKADNGDVDAMFEIGVYYASELENIRDDSPHALYWLELAAKNGHVWAQNEMGVTYRDGRFGVATDFKKAFVWFKQAADGSDNMAQFNIGRLYRDGLGTHRDLIKSLNYMELAAVNENLDAVYSTALAYEQGMGTTTDLKKYDYYRNQSHSKGYTKYNFFICEYRFFSDDKISNTIIERMFLNYYEMAMAVESFDEALLTFANDYLYSDDFETNMEIFLTIDIKMNPHIYKYDVAETTRKAFIDKVMVSLSIYNQADKDKIEYEMIRVASLLGNRSAQEQLSKIYATGRGIKKSRNEARYWAKRAKSNVRK